MRWFEGSIAEAVAQAKAQNVVFIVFVEGTDDMSRQLSETLEEPRVSQLLSDSGRFLSIKLSSTSPNYMHFASIYHFVPVPSLFFIGRDGSPLEVVCAGVTPDNLTERVNVILTQHYKTSDPTSAATSSPSASSSQAFIQQESKPQTQTAIPQSSTEARPVAVSFQNVPGALESLQSKSDELQSKKENSAPRPTVASTQPIEEQGKLEAARVASVPDRSTQTFNNDGGPTASKQARKEDVEYEMVCDGDVCVRKPKAAASPPPASEEPSTEQMVTEASPPEAPALDARVERAKEIIEQKRRENEAKEKELERQKELERRSTGQGVAELKRWQAEQELKQHAEERRREKAANNEVRQRILEQIAQDRAERRAREAPVAPPAAAAPSSPTVPAHPSGGESSAATHTRIHLKLVDGSSHVAQFQADNTIATVHRYITDSVKPSQGSFTLWTAFPRRSLPPDDSTLRELGLVPSSALLVLPASASAATPSAAGGAPVAVPHIIVQIYTMITSLLFTVIIEPAQDAWSWLSARLFPPPPGSAPASHRPPPPAAPTATGLRHRPGTSNVHRLTEDRSSDDENSTWNGNSTQQM